MTKAVRTNSAEVPERGLRWVGARRARLRVFDDRVECGDWCIPYSDVTVAKVLRYKVYFVVPAEVLQLTTDTDSFFFGVNPWAKPSEHLSVATTAEDLKLGHSPFSIALRVGLFGYLTYFAWRTLTGSP